LNAIKELVRERLTVEASLGEGFRLCIRQGLLTSTKIDLQEDLLFEFQKYFDSSWPSWQEECIENIGSIVNQFYNHGSHKMKIFFDPDETIWTRSDDSIFFVDLPKIIIIVNGMKIHEMRGCLGLCHKEITNKFWATITIPSLKELPDFWISINNINIYTIFCRKLTSTLCEWIYEKSNIILKQLYLRSKGNAYSDKRVGWLEISAFGLNDSELIEPFRVLYDSTLEAKQIIIKSPIISQKLSNLFFKTTNIKETINTFIESNSPNYYWFSSPFLMETANNNSEQMNIFFVRYKDGDKISVIGFGPDYSLDGKLAQYVVRQVAAQHYKSI
jgi:hypothetical protein